MSKINLGEGLQGVIVKTKRILILPVEPIRSAAARFWKSIDKNGPINPLIGTPCWIWTGYKKNRYGVISICNKQLYVHRLSFFYSKGYFSPKNVCHSCDNRSCVRPDHLFEGSDADNFQDMRKKGRNSPPPVFKGELNNNPKVKLSNEEVAQIRFARESLRDSQRKIARRFNVSQSTVWRIIHGRVRNG